MDSASREAAPNGYDACRSDMWSCGVILYALLTSSLPFDADDMFELIALIVSGIPKRPLPRRCGAQAADLVGKLIARDPGARLTAAECLEHPWLSVGVAEQPEGLRAAKTLPTLPSSIDSSGAAASGGDGGTEVAGAAEYRRGVTETTNFYRRLMERERKAAEAVAEADAASRAAVTDDAAGGGGSSEKDAAPYVSEADGDGGDDGAEDSAEEPRAKGRNLTKAEMEEIKAIRQEQQQRDGARG
jgi:hypothetical protein